MCCRRRSNLQKPIPVSRETEGQGEGSALSRARSAQVHLPEPPENPLLRPGKPSGCSSPSPSSNQADCSLFFPLTPCGATWGWAGTNTLEEAQGQAEPQRLPIRSQAPSLSTSTLGRASAHSAGASGHLKVHARTRSHPRSPGLLPAPCSQVCVSTWPRREGGASTCPHLPHLQRQAGRGLPRRARIPHAPPPCSWRGVDWRHTPFPEVCCHRKAA